MTHSLVASESEVSSVHTMTNSSLKFKAVT